ncbi:7258_t:CDS:2 [Acaulospora colombiana]|uniref:7258_t:CDS:1 n=1 Tax=Acaulospora colombiana TaxID=27376 RepID=A0ACA9KYZ0_9GLOM|nr:7258_t:CDS:2 [Acaulospora colombiana]
MSTFIEDFTSTANEDLYSRLSLTSEATSSEIKNAYHRLALRYHPDKHTNATPEEREEATRKFQSLGYAYAILSDPQKREIYDKTGETEGLDRFDNLDKEGWDAFFRELWSGVVNSESIEEFRASYQGSPEERKDLIEAYKKFQGDMEIIMQYIPCGTVDDEKRFIKILRSAISSGEISSFKKFTASTSSAARAKRKKESENEAKEAEEMAKKYGLDQKLLKGNCGNEEDQLKQIIQSRGEKRMSALLESLESRYAAGKSKKSKPNPSKGKKKKDKKRDDFIVSEEEEEIDELAPEPTEEEFQELQKKLMANKASSSKEKGPNKSGKMNGSSKSGKVGRSKRGTE